MKTRANWIRVTRSSRCPICKHTDWCVRSADGKVVLCMRIESSRPSRGQVGGWIHRLEDPLPEIAVRPKERPEPIRDWSAEARRMWSHANAQATRERLSLELGLNAEILKKMGVGWGFDEHRMVEFSSWPEFDAERNVTGISRRYADGRKNMIKGSKHGLYYVYDWDYSLTPVVITEGGSDTAGLAGLGVAVIGRPGVTGGADEICRMLSSHPHRSICVIGEMDEKPHKRGQHKQCPSWCDGCMWCFPGKAGAAMFAERLASRLKRSVSWCMLPDVKDSREWINTHPFGTKEDFLADLREGYRRIHQTA